MKNTFKFVALASGLMLSGSLHAGTLVGNFMATCSGCVLHLDTKELSCASCDNRAGAPIKDVKLDVSKVPGVDNVVGSLNANISNCDAVLTDAVKCSEPLNPTLMPLKPSDK